MLLRITDRRYGVLACRREMLAWADNPDLFPAVCHRSGRKHSRSGNNRATPDKIRAALAGPAH